MDIDRDKVTYNNPLHPLDLNLNIYYDIRNEFEKYQQQAKALNLVQEGMGAERLSQILAQKLRVQPMRIQKTLIKSLYQNLITWEIFQQILDKESCIREDILDWIMYEFPIKIFRLEEKKNFKPKLRDSDKIFSIEKMIEIDLDGIYYYVVLFDDCTISLMKSENYQIVCEQQQRFIFDKNQFFLEKCSQIKDSEFNQNRTQIFQQKTQNSSIYHSSDKAKNEFYQFDKDKGSSTNMNKSNFKINQTAPQNIMNNLNLDKSYINISQQGIVKTKQDNLIEQEKIYKILVQGNQKNQKETNFDDLDYLLNNNKRVIKQMMKIKLAKRFLMTTNSKYNYSQKNIKKSKNILPTQKNQNQENFLFTMIKNFRISSLICKFANKMLHILDIIKERKAMSNKFQKWSNMSQNEQNYLLKNRKNMHQIFRKFSELPDGTDVNFSKAVSKIIVNEQMNNMNLNNLQKLDPSLSVINSPKQNQQDFVSSRRRVTTTDGTLARFSSNLNKDQKRDRQTNKSLIDQKVKQIQNQERSLSSTNRQKLAQVKQINQINSKNQSIQQNKNSGFIVNTETYNSTERENQIQISQINLAQKLQDQQSFCLKTEQSYQKKSQFNNKIIQNQTQQVRQQTTQFQSQNNQVGLNLNQKYQINAKQMVENARRDKEHYQEFFSRKNSRFPQGENEKNHRKSMSESIYKDFDEKKKEFNQNLDQESKFQKRNMYFNLIKSDKIKKRKHIFSIAYNPIHKIIATTSADRELKMQYMYWDKNQIVLQQVYSQIFDDVILNVAFCFNDIRKNWNLITQFPKELRIFEFEWNVREKKINFSTNPIFKYLFTENGETVLVDKMIFSHNLGCIVTSLSGYMYIFINKSSTLCKDAEVQFSLFWKYKVKQDNKQLKISASCYSEKYKKIFLGTFCGKLIIVEPFGQEIIDILDVCQKQIQDMFCFDKQSELIVVSIDKSVYIYDQNRANNIQTLKQMNTKGNNLFQSQITCSFFSEYSEKLFVSSNETLVYKSQVDNNLLLERKKLQIQYNWRNREFEKQQIQNIQFGSQVKIKKQQNNIEKDVQNLMIQDNQAENIQKMSFAQLSLLHKRQKLTITNAFMSGDIFVTVSEEYEIKIYNKISFKLKYSYLLIVQDQIENLIINNKLLIYTNQKSNIIIRNLYSEEVYQEISKYEGFPLKIESICLLPEKSEFFLACGSIEGKILFCQSVLKKVKKLNSMTVQAHKKPIHLLKSNNNFLVSLSEDSFLVVWTMISSSIKHEINLQKQTIFDLNHQKLNMSLILQMEFYSEEDDRFFLKNEKGDLIQVNAHDAQIDQSSLKIGEFSHFKINKSGEKLILLDQEFQSYLYKRKLNLNASITDQNNKIHLKANHHLAYFISQYVSNSVSDSPEREYEKNSISIENHQQTKILNEKNLLNDKKRAGVNLKKVQEIQSMFSEDENWKQKSDLGILLKRKLTQSRLDYNTDNLVILDGKQIPDNDYSRFNSPIKSQKKQQLI